MNHKLIQTVFTFSIFGLLLLGLLLITGHQGLSLTFSRYLFDLTALGIVLYILGLSR